MSPSRQEAFSSRPQPWKCFLGTRRERCVPRVTLKGRANNTRHQPGDDTNPVGVSKGISIMTRATNTQDRTGGASGSTRQEEAPGQLAIFFSLLFSTWFQKKKLNPQKTVKKLQRIFICCKTLKKIKSEIIYITLLQKLFTERFSLFCVDTGL